MGTVAYEIRGGDILPLTFKNLEKCLDTWDQLLDNARPGSSYQLYDARTGALVSEYINNRQS